MTVEDFVRLPESVGTQDVRYELVEGELFTMSPGMLPHNLIRDKLLFVLMSFLQDRKLGTVVSEQAFQLSERTVRVPDIALVRAGRQLEEAMSKGPGHRHAEQHEAYREQ